MKKLSLLFLSFCSAIVFAQFTSPGTGITYNLASLSAAAPTDFQDMGTFYWMKKDITISANDKLIIDESTTIKVESDITLYVFGEYKTTTSNVVIESMDSGFPFKGIRFEDGSIAEMKNTHINYGGGIRVLTANFLMDNCIVSNNHGGVSTTGAIGFSKGNPVVSNSQFLDNAKPALGSAANSTVSALFINNYLFGNNKENSNAPQINMGPGGADSIKIINNTIIGNRNFDRVGGISVSALAGGINKFRIEGNIIKDNRYGFTSLGSVSSGIIKDNIFEDNNTETNPLMGGSGISLNNTGMIVITGNKIRNSLWGITLIGSTTANLGDDENPGNNIFLNNGNGGQIYALYNNTANPVNAKNNCWREGELSDDAMVESVISHQIDDSALGLVTFSPYLCSVLATNEKTLSKNNMYPNPNNGTFIFETEKPGNIIISDITGKIIYTGIVSKGKNQVSVRKSGSGNYLLIYQSEGKKESMKLIIK